MSSHPYDLDRFPKFLKDWNEFHAAQTCSRVVAGLIDVFEPVFSLVPDSASYPGSASIGLGRDPGDDYRFGFWR